MLKKSIITSALLCSSLAWGSQAANEISKEYISKVTTHLDGLKNQSSVIDQAEKDVEVAKGAVRPAERNVNEIEKSLGEEKDNRSAYPRRIKRDNESIEEMRSESESIFRNTFPEFTSPEEAIRSVKSDVNFLQQEKNILEDRLRRKENEYASALSSARSDVNTNRSILEQNLRELSDVETKLPQAINELRDAREALRRAEQIVNDPQLPRRIRQAEERLETINQERIAEGKSCGGLSPIFSGVCRRWIEAREELKELRAIGRPGSLRPYRQRVAQAERTLENLRDSKRNLSSRTNFLEDDLRRSESRVSNLEEDLRLETQPLRGDIADVDRRLRGLDSKLAQAQRLESLESSIGSIGRRVERNEEKLAALPALIAKLERNLADAKQTLENAQEALADLNENLAREQNVLTAQKTEINALRLELNDSLSTVVTLNPSAVVTPNVDTEIMTSNDWSVITTDLDNEWNRATCSAERLEIVEEGDSEVITSANLKVVNLVNPTSGFNEPVVVMTVDSARNDLVNFSKVTVRASSSKTYTFDLIYSKSSQNKLFFMADLNDREGLIEIILKKSRMEVVLTNLNSAESEEIIFSLKGSTKALNSDSSRDNSLKNACGGIDILEL
jgi:predicted  nucleic acid-binding Zn-ribbon protein